jgi:hypothetical protein
MFEKIHNVNLRTSPKTSFESSLTSTAQKYKNLLIQKRFSVLHLYK